MSKAVGRSKEGIKSLIVYWYKGMDFTVLEVGKIKRATITSCTLGAHVRRSIAHELKIYGTRADPSGCLAGTVSLPSRSSSQLHLLELAIAQRCTGERSAPAAPSHPFHPPHRYNTCLLHTPLTFPHEPWTLCPRRRRLVVMSVSPPFPLLLQHKRV